MTAGIKTKLFCTKNILKFRRAVTTNERCIIWYIFSLLSQVQVVRVKHLASTWHLEWIRDRKDWAQVSEWKANRRYLAIPKIEGSEKSYQSMMLGNRRSVRNSSRTSLPAADLYLPIPCQLSWLSSKKQQRVAAGGTPGKQSRHTAPGHCSGRVCQNGFCRRTVHWFVSQWIQNWERTQTTSTWRKVIPVRKKM